MKIKLEYGEGSIVFYDGKIRNSVTGIINASKKDKSYMELEKTICTEGIYVIEITENSRTKVYEVDNEFFFYCVTDNEFYRGDLLNEVREVFFNYMMSSESNFEKVKELFFQNAK